MSLNQVENFDFSKKEDQEQFNDLPVNAREILKDSAHGEALKENTIISLQRGEKVSDEEITEMIGEPNSFDDLYASMRNIGVLAADPALVFSRDYNANEEIESIKKVRQGELKSYSLSDRFGIRKTVNRLLSAESGNGKSDLPANKNFRTRDFRDEESRIFYNKKSRIFRERDEESRNFRNER